MKKYRASLGVPITGGFTEAVTAWTGATLLVELYRKVGIEAAVEQTLPRKKSPERPRRDIETLPQDAWKLWKEEKRGMIREWAEVSYVPGRQYERRDSQPYRYLAIRVRRQQGKLLENGAKVHHSAVVTNIWDMVGQELLEWQRGKAGTIEHIPNILDSELAAGVYPGANPW